MQRNPYKNPNPQGKGLVPVLADWQGSRPACARAKNPAELLFDWFASALVLSADFRFKPAQGQTYFLYAREGSWKLSLVGPKEWGDGEMGDCLGVCELRADMTWAISPDEELAHKPRLQKMLAELAADFMQDLENDDAVSEHLPGYRRDLPYYQRMLATGLGASLRDSARAGGSLQRPLRALLEESGGDLPRRLMQSAAATDAE